MVTMATDTTAQTLMNAHYRLTVVTQMRAALIFPDLSIALVKQVLPEMDPVVKMLTSA